MNSRRKLLTAGLVVFSRAGYHGAKTRAIALEAGVNESLIMRHFKSKEGLFVAVIAENIGLASTVDRYPPRETLRDELQSYARAIFARDEERRDLIRLLIGHTMVDPTFMSRLSKVMSKTCLGVITPRLICLRDRGELPADVNLLALENAVLHVAFANSFFCNITDAMSKDDGLHLLDATLDALAAGVQAGRFRITPGTNWPE